MSMVIDSAFLCLILVFVGLYIMTNYIADKRIMLYFMGFILFLFSAVKDPVCFRDMEEYQKIFEYSISGGYHIKDNINIGYLFFNQIIRYFTDNFVLFLSIISFIVLFLNIRFIEKYSEDWNLSLLLYVPVLYFYCFSPLRQALAMGIGLIAYGYVLDRKLIPFCITCLIAMAFHSTAIVMFPIYFIYGLNMDKKGKIALLAGSLILVFSMQIIGKFLTSYQSWYSGYASSKYSASALRLIQKLFFLALYIYALGGDVFKKNINFLVFLFALFEIVLYLGSAGIDGIYRLRWYFDMGEIIGLPIIYTYLYSKVKYPGFLTWIYIISLFVSCLQFLASENFEFGYHTIF